MSAVLTRRPYFNTYYPDGSLVGVFNGQKNPIAQVNYTTDFTDSYKANFFQFFEIKFNKYLKFRANINANFYLDKRKSPFISFSSKMLINLSDITAARFPEPENH